MAYEFDEQGQFLGDGIDVDAIETGYQDLPVGTYNCRLVAAVGKLSKKEQPMVQASFEVIDGPQKGADCTLFYSLVVKPPRAAGGKPLARGIGDMKAAFAAVGEPLKAGTVFPLQAQKAANIYMKRVGGKTVQIAVVKDKKNPEDTRKQLLGLAKGAAAAASTGTDDEDDLL